MRTIGVPAVVLAVAAAGCGGPHAVEVPKNTPPGLRAEFEGRNRLHQRVDGARLTITARWEQDPGIEESLRVYWAIDYAGPRRPFAIATPGARTDPAVAHFWYLRPDGTTASITWGWGGPSFGPMPHLDKEAFSVAVGGKPVTGRLAQGSSYLKARFGREPGPGDPMLWVQLEYAATERGDGFDRVYDPITLQSSRGADWGFDAWTGHLWSPVVEVAVK